MTEETTIPTATDPAAAAGSREQAKSLLQRLTEAYPQVFFAADARQVKALKIGIHKDLKPVVKDWGFEAAALRIALSMYTHALRYQFALLKEPHRIDLQGESAGEISEENRRLAQEKIKTIKEKRRQRPPAEAAAAERRPRKPKATRPQVSQASLLELQRKFNRED